MTVCVAAIANNGLVIGASDRMLSNAEVAYEPESRKIGTITSAIVALWSGDPSIISQVLGAVQLDVNALLAQQPPPDWLNVKDVVDLYISHWSRLRRKRAEDALLTPLGLTLDTFVERNRSLEPAMSEKLATALVGYRLPSTSCIIAGLDHSGSHIWVLDDGHPICHDAVGFGVIGAGSRHADSQMTTGRHSRAKSPSETLVLVHMAKRRAEVTPSVGAATDIVLVGPTLGQYAFLEDNWMSKLDTDFASLQDAEKSAFKGAVGEFDIFLAGLNNKPEGTQEADEDPAPDSSSPPTA